MTEIKLKYSKIVDSMDRVHDDKLKFQNDDNLLFEIMFIDIRSAEIHMQHLKNKRTKQGINSN